jgi:hypothetical protein
MTIGIVPNLNTTWYDPGRISGDPIIIHDINYVGGSLTAKSTTKTIHRYLQDFLKQTISTSIRDGLGLNVSSQTITIATGHAIINGRWIYNDAQASYNCSGLSNGDYYLHFTLIEQLASATRDLQQETISIQSTLVGSYSHTSAKLILGRFTVTSGTPVITSSNIVTQAIATTAIIPATSPTGSISSVVDIYSGSHILTKQLTSEDNGTRIHKKAIFNDQDTTPVGDIQLINKDQISTFRNNADSDYVSIDIKSVKISGTEIITSGRGLISITSLNGLPIPSSNIVGINDTQTISNKTLLDTTVFADATDQTKKARFEPGSISAGQTRVITLVDENITIVGQDNVQTLTNKTLTTPTISSFANAPHNHSNSDGGSQFNPNNAFSTILNVPLGGTGLSSITSGGFIIGNGSSTPTVTARPNTAQLFIGQASGNPILAALSGDVTMDANGVVTILDNSHAHGDTYETKTILNSRFRVGSSNENLIHGHYIGGQGSKLKTGGSNTYLPIVEPTTTGSLSVYMSFFVPLPAVLRSGEILRVTEIKFNLIDADSSNYVNSTYIYELKSTLDIEQVEFNATDFNTIGIKTLAVSTTSIESNSSGIIVSFLIAVTNVNDFAMSGLISVKYHYD